MESTTSPKRRARVAPPMRGAARDRAKPLGWTRAVAPFVALATMLAGGQASAQMVVDRLWVDLRLNQSNRGDIIVRNEGTERFFVQVTAEEIMEPGTATEARRSDPDPEKLGLLATPNRIVLEPGAQRSVRVVSLDRRLERDRIYRVRIAPAVGEVEAGAEAPSEHAVGLKVVTAYEVLVVARPDAPNADVNWTKTDTALTLTHAGNTSTFLFDGKVCPVETPDTCRTVEARRLHPGQSLTIDLTKPTDVVTMRQRTFVGSEARDLRF